MSIFSRMVKGEAFDHKKLIATMEYELERGTLKTRLREDGEMIFWFEVLHPINKYPELEKNSRLRDRVLAGEPNQREENTECKETGNTSQRDVIDGFQIS